MREYLYLARWDQTYGFLVSGSPPMLVRLLALNTLFLVLYAVRKSTGARPLSAGMALLVQLAVLGANLLVLFQPQVENYLLHLMNRF